MYSKVTEDMANASILADLQQKQDSEFDALLPGLHQKVLYSAVTFIPATCLPSVVVGHSIIEVFLIQTEKDLENLKLQFRQARKEDHCDCLAAVVLGSFELSEEEKIYITALEEKYEALRTVMLRHCLKLEIGLAWERLVFLHACVVPTVLAALQGICIFTLLFIKRLKYSQHRLDERELHRRVLKKKKEEEKLRKDGKLEQMAELVAPLEKVGRRIMVKYTRLLNSVV